MVWRTSRFWGETKTTRGQGWGAILLSRYYSGQHGQRRGVPGLSHWWGTMGRGRPSYAIKECLRSIGGVCGKDRTPSLQVCLPSSSLSFFLFLSPSFNSYIFSHFLSFATANFFTSEWSLWGHVSSEASMIEIDHYFGGISKTCTAELSLRMSIHDYEQPLPLPSPLPTVDII